MNVPNFRKRSSGRLWGVASQRYVWCDSRTRSSSYKFSSCWMTERWSTSHMVLPMASARSKLSPPVESMGIALGWCATRTFTSRELFHFILVKVSTKPVINRKTENPVFSGNNWNNSFRKSDNTGHMIQDIVMILINFKGIIISFTQTALLKLRV